MYCCVLYITYKLKFFIWIATSGGSMEGGIRSIFTFCPGKSHCLFLLENYTVQVTSSVLFYFRNTGKLSVFFFICHPSGIHDIQDIWPPPHPCPLICPELLIVYVHKSRAPGTYLFVCAPLIMLYKSGWQTSTNNARMKNSRDLVLGEVVYIPIIYHPRFLT